MEGEIAPMSAPIWHDVRGADLLLRLRIQPRASREGIDGVREGRLRVRVSSPPVDGAANDRVIRVLAQVLDVPRSSITLTRGEKSRDKDLTVHGVAARASELVARLSAPQL
jgi:uncharacterized protein (TIGR00251 family)